MPPKPVSPPVLPGAAAKLAGFVLENAETVKEKKKERRMELAGLEPGDPLSTVHLIKLGFKNVVTNVPRLLKKYWLFL
ncbi:hypothetical protein [Phosphitispora sp. TUW77]|uniref:hypothetical protein n=1 Tax=Phosphitispora sp. TUW77 TaxID=3152361 RepID=UPI003AB6BD64